LVQKVFLTPPAMCAITVQSKVSKLVVLVNI
jgi:hypothetical protein